MLLRSSGAIGRPEILQYSSLESVQIQRLMLQTHANSRSRRRDEEARRDNDRDGGFVAATMAASFPPTRAGNHSNDTTGTPQLHLPY